MPCSSDEPYRLRATSTGITCRNGARSAVRPAPESATLGTRGDQTALPGWGMSRKYMNTTVRPCPSKGVDTPVGWPAGERRHRQV